MSYAYFSGRGKRGRDLGRQQVRKLVAEKTKQMNNQMIIGRGVLTWMRYERISDRYGSVYLVEDGSGVEVEMFLPKGKGRLVVLVIDAHQSHHIGDFARGIGPETPVNGDRLVLGEGEAFSEVRGRITVVGVRPDDGRGNDWLDPHALYRCHNSLVELIWEPKL